MINYIYIMHKAQESTTACSSVLLPRGGQPPSGACTQNSQSLIRKGPCGLCSFLGPVPETPSCQAAPSDSKPP